MVESSSGASLPGAELVEIGIRDLDREVESIEALLVSIGAPRLRHLGLAIPKTLPEPELGLYGLLSKEHGDAAHSRYNALIRRLVSYERAATRLRVDGEHGVRRIPVYEPRPIHSSPPS